MLVTNWMQTPAICIDAAQSMQDAIGLMKRNEIRILPVLRGEALVGVLSDRDLKRASASDATTLDVYELAYLLGRVAVESIMTTAPITVPPDYTVSESAAIMLERKISGLPVVDNGTVVGVLTQSDVDRALLTLSGLRQGGLQLGFLLANRPGSILAIANLVRGEGGRLISILSTTEGVPEGYRKVYLRVYLLTWERVSDLVGKLPSGAQLLYMVDHENGRRRIF